METAKANMTTTIGTITIKYDSGSPKSYPMKVGALDKPYDGKFKGVDWDKAQPRIEYTDDPAEHEMTDVEFAVSEANFRGQVGLSIVDALAKGLTRRLVARYEVPSEVGKDNDHVLTASSTPGWTLRVKVKRIASQ